MTGQPNVGEAGPTLRARHVFQQRFRQLNGSRAKVLAETLRLRIDAGGRGDALAEKSDHNEVERANVGQWIPLDLQFSRLRQQLLQPLHGPSPLRAHTPLFALPPLAPD